MVSMRRNALLAVILAIVAFFWIWFFGYLGAKAYWVALVTFGVCLAYGASLSTSIPWMTLGGVLGAVLGLLTFMLYMKVLPLYYGLSVAIAGGIFILFAGLVSIPKLREMLPMILVGWGSFLGAMARFDFLFSEQPVQAIPRTMTTFVGVLLSLLFGLFLAAVLDVLVLTPRKAPSVQLPAEPPKIMD